MEKGVFVRRLEKLMRLRSSNLSDHIAQKSTTPTSRCYFTSPCAASNSIFSGTDYGIPFPWLPMFFFSSSKNIFLLTYRHTPKVAPCFLGLIKATHRSNSGLINGCISPSTVFPRAYLKISFRTFVYALVCPQPPICEQRTNSSV
jgi:hypothetical protein